MENTLTKREHEILMLVCIGLKSKEISDLLFISPRTVDNHLQNLFQKFGVNNRVKLMIETRRKDLLDIDSYL